MRGGIPPRGLLEVDMAARLVRIEARHPATAALEAAAAVLRKGGIVALPTETYYGLAVDPENAGAVRYLFRWKRRADDKAVPILISRREQQTGMVRHPIPPALDLLTEAFWPGPLNVVVPVREGYAPEALGGGERIALRVTAHPIARAVIEHFGAAVTGTSANRSGQPPCCAAEELRGQLERETDLILDGGRCPGGMPSTVLDLTSKPYRILRSGAITHRELLAVLGRDLA
jgi:L-threonylcarbamoyladenylate synthase